MRKIRFRVNLYEVTWEITEIASTTNTPPATTNTNSCLLINATIPSAAPNASEPTSPINICAGYALNHRKPIPAATSAPQNTDNSAEPATYGTCRYSAN